jgi:hypothetical protein
MRYTFIFLVMTLLILSCNKPVVKYNPDFEGTWRTASTFDTTLNETLVSEIILEGKEGAYYNSCRDTCGNNLCDCIVVQTGKPVMNSTKDQMKFGTSSYPVSIQQEPTLDPNGNWFMIIDNKTFFKTN